MRFFDVFHMIYFASIGIQKTRQQADLDPNCGPRQSIRGCSMTIDPN
jgi:hypothetical protein